MDFTYSCLSNSDFSLQTAFKNQVNASPFLKDGFTPDVKTNQVSKSELLSIPSCEFPWET